MIGDFKGEVKYKVVTALLQAYQDILDYDGVKSILKEAEMLHLKNIKYEKQNQNLDFFSFKKIIAAQNCLLYESSMLLFEIGKKLSFYLFPYGISFDNIIKEINSLIDTDWKVEILEKFQKEVIVKVHRCIFCSEIGVPCDMFKGFLVHSLEKSLPSDYKVMHYTDIENVKEPDHNTFILKLRIKKNIK